jgi:hypothetical protein
MEFPFRAYQTAKQDSQQDGQPFACKRERVYGVSKKLIDV